MCLKFIFLFYFNRPVTNKLVQMTVGLIWVSLLHHLFLFLSDFNQLCYGSYHKGINTESVACLLVVILSLSAESRPS